jgi:hypothetical protein
MSLIAMTTFAETVSGYDSHTEASENSLRKGLTQTRKDDVTYLFDVYWLRDRSCQGAVQKPTLSSIYSVAVQKPTCLSMQTYY